MNTKREAWDAFCREFPEYVETVKAVAEVFGVDALEIVIDGGLIEWKRETQRRRYEIST